MIPTTKKDNVLKKHSGLISISKPLTLAQKKAFNGLLYKAREDLKKDGSLKEFTISMYDIKKLVGRLTDNNTQLKKALKELLSIVVEYNILKKDKTYSWVASSLISHFEISKLDKDTIIYGFSKPILENLIEPKMYAPISLGITRDLKSKYSLSLYEVLSDYRNLKEIKIDFNNLKKALGISDTFTYGDFNKKILTKSIKEINAKTNLKIETKTEKNGRVIESIVFYIKDKNNKKAMGNKDLFKLIKKIREYNEAIYYPYNNQLVYIKEKDNKLMYQTTQEELLGVDANLFYDEMFNNYYDRIISIIDNKKTSFFEDDLEELKFLFLNKGKYLVLTKKNKSLKYYFRDIVKEKDNLFSVKYLIENKKEYHSDKFYSFTQLMGVLKNIE